jgi:hypothetical protein
MERRQRLPVFRLLDSWALAGNLAGVEVLDIPFEDHRLNRAGEVEVFKSAHDVATTPLVFPEAGYTCGLRTYLLRASGGRVPSPPA